MPLSLDVEFGDDTCQTVGTVAVSGPIFDGLTIGSLIATLLLLSATIAVGRAGPRGRGRPLVELFVGLLAGLAGTMTLFGAGAIALDSILWWIAPLILAVLGVALGTAAPFGRDTGTGAADTGNQRHRRVRERGHGPHLAACSDIPNDPRIDQGRPDPSHHRRLQRPGRGPAGLKEVAGPGAP